ncbi:U3 small nucleolar RNA-associated protein [Gracilaria domingensis]|nr:U3 small nucleolar RNA-associated protein [Gracilaria domingensis]
MRPLLLLSPDADRLTLMPDAEQQLQAAAVELILRLAPVFLLRSTQSVLDWLLVGLSLPTHGSDDEYDQLIVSALPFCEEQMFVRLLERMAPLRPKWHFLWPVVKQSKPPPLSFMVKNFPQHLFSVPMQSATRSASMRISVSSISSFLANTLTRRVLIPADAPVLTLACVDSLRKLTSSKFVKRAQHMPTNLIAAMLSAVGVAMSAKLVQPTVLQAASHACAYVLLNCNESQLKRSAAICLVFTSTTLPAFVPAKVARKLLRSPALHPELKGLDPRYASSLFGALVLTSIGDEPQSIRWSLLKEALSLSSLLTNDTIRRCLIDLLDKLSPEVESEQLVHDEAVRGLTSVFAPLARGRFAEATDLAMREHFNRRKKKARKDRYVIVDQALAQALLGTQFAFVTAGQDLSSLSLSAALDHPEPSVRLAALRHFAKDSEFKSHAEPSAIEVLMAKFTAMIRLEEDLRMVDIACHCVLNVSRPQDIQDALSLVFTRYIGEHEQMRKKAMKKKKIKRKHMLLKALFSRMLMFCEELMTENSSSIHAMLCGIVIGGYLPNSLEKGDEETMMSFLSRYWKEMNLSKGPQESAESNMEQHVTTVVQGMLSMDKVEVTKFCDALKTWDRKWVLNASSLWLQQLEKRPPSNWSERKLKTILHFLSSAYEAQGRLPKPVILVLTKHSRLFCKQRSSAKGKLTVITDVWSMVARDGSDHACQAFLHAIVSESNLTTCIELLKDLCFSGATQETRAVSLRWYISLCVMHPCEDVRKDAIIVLIRILYGGDDQIQKIASEVCRCAIQRDGMKKRELRTELWTFLTVFSRLPTDFNRDPHSGELERLIYTDIQRRIITPIKTPHPLLFSKQDEFEVPVDFDALMLIAVQEKDNRHVVNAFLRALHGYRIQTAEQCSSVISILLSYLPSLFSSGKDQNVILENVSRLTQTLCEAPVEILSDASQLTDLSSLTISQLKAFSSKAVSSYESKEEVLTTLLGLSALLVTVFKESKSTRELRILLLGYLFSFSTLSSRLGISSRGNIDIICRGSVSIEELMLILETGYVTLSPSQKRQRVSEVNRLGDHSEIARDAYRGVLEALLRWASRNDVERFLCLSGSLDGLKCCLFDLLVSSTALREDGRFSMDDVEYDLSLLLQVQTFLYKIQPSRPRRSIDVNEIAEIAQYVRAESEETPVTSSVRQSAVRLLEILAPIYGADMHDVLAPVVENLVSKGDATRALHSLDAFVPALVESGCDFERICSWVIEAGYSDGSLHDSHKGAIALSSCCRLVPNSKQAVVTSIRLLERHLKNVDDDLVARECANILLDVRMNPVDDVDTLRRSPARIRCRAAFTVLQSPVFITKLFSTANELSTQEGIDLNNAFSFLFLELLVCDDMDGRRDSVAALVAILPLPLFENCALQGLNSKDSKVRTRTMNTLGERFEADDAPVTYSWNKDEHSVLDAKKIGSIELSFLTEIGATLCSFCDGTHSFATSEERILSASTMEKLVSTVGSSHKQVVSSFAGRLLDLVRIDKLTPCLSEMEEKKTECQLAGACLDLFTCFVRCLEKSAIPFVPIVLASASEILERVFNPRSTPPSPETRSSTFFSTLICISEAAVMFITTVLDTCPTFLGTRTLQSLISLSLTSEADILSGLLQLAMTKATPGTIAAALSRATEKLRQSNASHDGISRVMRAFSGGLDKMHKSEVMLHMHQFEQSITRCLEFGRYGPPGSSSSGFDYVDNAENSQGSTDSLLSQFHEIDQSCSEALASLVMKIPELKFKKLFNGFVQWCDSGSMSPEAQIACQALEVKVVSNLTRATPFYQLVVHLFEKLQFIMIPYVFQVLEDILHHVSRKQYGITSSKLDVDETASPNRKRKRAKLEKESHFFICSMLLGFEERVIQNCLQIVLMVLKQKLGPELFTATVATKILDSLLTAFDNSDGESEKVSQAMCALATRITASGKASESREESRELLISFARSLLLRTRETSIGVRAGALRVSCAVAQAVGDEYLVTLPESMPVLAEVIDDEQNLVRKEANRYVRILEGLAGENIMDQLK